MKQETKELVEWLKDHLSHYRNQLAAGQIKVGLATGEKEEKNAYAAISFLNSLPEIELHLCRGGYIQDKNGTPCCDGDKVKIKDREYTLYWSKSDGCFYMRLDILPEFLERLSINIEKVNK